MVVPADVPRAQRATFEENYNALTRGTEYALLFAADQKIEHLNPINPDDLFVLAASPHLKCLATHPGLIARYAEQYPDVNYVAKVNGKSFLIPVSQRDPLSAQHYSIASIMRLKAAGANIRGVGYTIYLGSEFEYRMLAEAGQLVHDAHQQGLVAILWMYPRGKAIRNETEARLTAGAAGVGASLGADFVKVRAPMAQNGASSAALMQDVVKSAGNAKVLCAGGERQDPEIFLRELHALLNTGHAAGSAVGRNIYQHDYARALKMASAISALVYERCSLAHALELIA